MISLIVPKLETNFLQRNYLGRQSLAEADTLCDTFHFGPFKNTNSGYAIFLWNDPAKKNLPAMVWDIFTFENMYLHTAVSPIFQYLFSILPNLPFNVLTIGVLSFIFCTYLKTQSSNG